MIPSVDRKEWYDLVTGSLKPKLTSPLLKIKISIFRRKVNRGMLTTKQAITELMKDCEKNYELYRQDLHQIFRNKKEESLHHS